MPKSRGREHTSLTETAALVVRELEKLGGIKMIAPGEIRTNARRSNGRFVTAAFTSAGFELLISGQSTQKVSIHTHTNPAGIFDELKKAKRLSGFIFKERERKPGI